jgi:hypothetical protein
VFHRRRQFDIAERIDLVMAAVFLSDETERMEQLEEHLALDFVYVSPSAVVDGPLGLSDAFVHYRHDEWRHTSLRRTSIVDLHHAFFRYSWQRIENGATAMEGWSFGNLNNHDLISRIVSFDGLLLDPHAGRK